MPRSTNNANDASEHAMRQKARTGQAKTNEILKKQAAENKGKDFHELKFTNPAAFNARAEEAFVELVRTLLEENHGKPYPIWEIYREASFEVKISIETAKRYLLKHSARRAEFRVWDKLVMLNPHYVPAPDPEEDGEA